MQMSVTLGATLVLAIPLTVAASALFCPQLPSGAQVRQENRFFEVRPRIVPANRESVVEIIPLHEHAQFKTDCTYELTYAPMISLPQRGGWAPGKKMHRRSGERPAPDHGVLRGGTGTRLRPRINLRRQETHHRPVPRLFAGGGSVRVAPVQGRFSHAQPLLGRRRVAGLRCGRLPPCRPAFHGADGPSVSTPHPSRPKRRLRVCLWTCAFIRAKRSIRPTTLCTSSASARMPGSPNCIATMNRLIAKRWRR